MLSSMTSLRTFIMATDCASVKPSSSSLCTNLRVSKWWSRDWRAVAWKARWCNGLSRMLVLDRGLPFCVVRVKDLFSNERLSVFVCLEESIANARIKY